MSKFVRLLAAAAVVFGLILATRSHTAVAAPKHGDLIDGQYIVTLKDSADVDRVIDALVTRNGYELLQRYEAALKGFAVRIPDNRLDKIRNHPLVASVEQDRVVALDPDIVAADPITIQAQTSPTGIDRVDAELSSAQSGNGSGSVDVDIAIIDTGISTTHPDLNVVNGKNCVARRGGSYNDDNGHGSHVAGTAAAKDDGNGVVGVAPGARLWAVKVLNRAGYGSDSTIICGVDYVTANASSIEVANMSLGGSGSNSACAADAYHNAICKSVNAGVTYVVAAGNSAANADGFRPATWDEVITVSALADFDGKPGGLASSSGTCRPSSTDDRLSDYSNYGADVDIIAPGTCIYSTFTGTGYQTYSGTSMASPHVAGAAALYKANNPSASPSAVKTALQNAGTTNWDNSTDPDGIKEKLLNVASF